MELKGIAMISPNIRFSTKLIGGPELYQMQVLSVLDRNEEGDVLVLAKDGKAGMGMIDHRDVLCFVPVVKKSGICMPVGLDMMTQGYWISIAMRVGIEKFNHAFVFKCIAKQAVIYSIDEVLEGM